MLFLLEPMLVHEYVCRFKGSQRGYYPKEFFKRGLQSPGIGILSEPEVNLGENGHAI